MGEPIVAAPEPARDVVLPVLPSEEPGRSWGAPTGPNAREREFSDAKSDGVSVSCDHEMIRTRCCKERDVSAFRRDVCFVVASTGMKKYLRHIAKCRTV